MNRIAPNTLFPAILPIWLITEAITPVASPSAKSLEYERTSLSHPLTLYRSYAPERDEAQFFAASPGHQ